MNLSLFFMILIDIEFFRSFLAKDVEEEFFQYLSKITAENIVVWSVSEGSVVFPKEPMMRIEGPLAICQLLETTLLTLVNYACLIATNAARYRIAVDNPSIELLEFGLRRAQGPDGGLSGILSQFFIFIFLTFSFLSIVF